MESPQESRTKTVSAAVSPNEQDWIALAVRVDKLGSTSEALRTRNLTQLIDRGRELDEQLHRIAASDSAS